MHAYRLVYSDCSKHSQDVGVFELPHDGPLLEELGLVLLTGPLLQHLNSYLQRTIWGAPSASAYFAKCTRSKALFSAMVERKRLNIQDSASMYVDAPGKRKKS